MKTLTLDQVIAILENASAVIVDDNAVTYANLFDKDEDWFLVIADDMNAVNEDERTFAATDNETVDQRDDGTLELIDTTGETVLIAPLVRAKPSA